ncbi:unnamed protein product, partial [Polarella glacialis]
MSLSAQPQQCLTARAPPRAPWPFAADSSQQPSASLRAPSSDGLPLPPPKAHDGSGTPVMGSPLYHRGRPIATPMGLAALWGDLPQKKAASVSAPSAPSQRVGRDPSPVPGPSWSPPAQHVAEPYQSVTPGRTLAGRPPTGPGNAPAPVQGGRCAMSPTRLIFAESEPSPQRGQSHANALYQPVQQQPLFQQVQPNVAPGGQRQERQEPDLIQQHVVFALRSNPQLQGRKVRQVCEGIYLIDGNEVNLEWQHSTQPGMRGHLVVVDGPLRQPFLDYLAKSDQNMHYDTLSIARTSNLHHLPKEKRITFDDKHKQYSRLEAMKVAKEQASLREKAADFTRAGQQMPDDLVLKYNKVLRQRLKHARSVEDDDLPPAMEAVEEQPKVAQPAATPAAMPAAAAASQALPTPPPMHTAPAATAAAVGQQQQTMQPPMLTARQLPPPTPRDHMLSMMTPRGISLNGVPSYLPASSASYRPPLGAAAASPFQPPIGRTWSGDTFTPMAQLAMASAAFPAGGAAAAPSAS